MANLRKSWLTALCWGTAVMFFGRVMLCCANEAGLVSCAQTASQNDRGSSPATSGQTPITHCSHCPSHTPLLTPDSALSLGGDDILNLAFFDKADFPPEGLAREIDYPPQLS
jgi:hypothetical protein